jgi:hypothetical protein
MNLTTPAWKEGMVQWPAFEVKPHIRDWNGHDRLVIGTTNLESQSPTATCRRS